MKPTKISTSNLQVAISMIYIDGSHMEGGGQILRTALALSTGNIYADKENSSMIDSEQIQKQQRDHLQALTVPMRLSGIKAFRPLW
jgi:hypothetical protein